MQLNRSIYYHCENPIFGSVWEWGYLHSITMTLTDIRWDFHKEISLKFLSLCLFGYIFKPGMSQLVAGVHLVSVFLFLCGCLYVYVCVFACMCMCVCVYTSPRLLITSGMMWHDMNPI